MAAPGRPSGPECEVLFGQLHQLRRNAGYPSTRAIAKLVTLSHTTVAQVLGGHRMPRWPTLEQIVTALEGNQGHFYSLWAAAFTALHSADPELPSAPPGNLEYQQTSCLVDEIAATATDLNRQGGWTLTAVVPAPDHPAKMTLILSRRTSRQEP